MSERYWIGYGATPESPNGRIFLALTKERGLKTDVLPADHFLAGMVRAYIDKSQGDRFVNELQARTQYTEATRSVAALTRAPAAKGSQPT